MRTGRWRFNGAKNPEGLGEKKEGGNSWMPHKHSHKTSSLCPFDTSRLTLRALQSWRMVPDPKLITGDRPLLSLECGQPRRGISLTWLPLSLWRDKLEGIKRRRGWDLLALRLPCIPAQPAHNSLMLMLHSSTAGKIWP